MKQSTALFSVTIVFILLFFHSGNAQVSAELKKSVSGLINTMVSVNISFDDATTVEQRNRRYTRVAYDTTLVEGDRNESVLMDIIAYDSARTVRITEHHSLQGRDMGSYSYTLDTNGTILYAYSERPRQHGRKDDIIDLRIGENDSALRAKYQQRAEASVVAFYKKLITQLGENTKPRLSGIIIGGKTFGELTKDELLNIQSLTLSDDLKSDYRITSFRMTIAWKKYTLLINDKDDKLTDDIREAVKEAGKGCQVFFRSVRCISKAGEQMILPEQTFTLK